MHPHREPQRPSYKAILIPLKTIVHFLIYVYLILTEEKAPKNSM